MRNNLSKIYQTLSFTAFIILILSACQKGITDSLPTTQTTTPPVTTSTLDKVKTYSEKDSFSDGTVMIDTFDISYDANDRVTLVASRGTGGKFVYNYTTDNIYTTDIYDTRGLSIHQNLFLNSIPLVDSSVQFDASSMDSTTEKYIYDANKNLVTYREYDYKASTGSTLFNETKYTYDAAGNQVSEKDKTSTTNYEYYPDLPNNISFGEVYLPRIKNLAKKTTYTSGGKTEVKNHTYTFDLKNRVSQEKQTVDNGDVFTISYAYY